MTSFEARFRGGMFGLAIGDALGVPVEFRSRGDLRREPVTGMQGGGTHNQPAGTWSDDTSMALCLLEGLTQGKDWNGIASLFRAWMNDGHWTPHGTVFDVGNVTRDALLRSADCGDARTAGGTDERSNG